MTKWNMLRSIGALAVLALASPTLASNGPVEQGTTDNAKHQRIAEGPGNVNPAAQNQNEAPTEPSACGCSNAPAGGGAGEPSARNPAKRTMREQHDQFLHDTWNNP
ncbi:MAG TPA: hypothetical protein VMK12_22180 [Anaeromyxobacteraceae bacterium]|nr:hypothetical protein [Anaeromyxobacteraceae bacterium]